jgi:predicted nicotinamide N-methyase
MNQNMNQTLNQSMKQPLENNLRHTISAGELQETHLPLCPEISLFLLSADYPRGKLDQDEMLAIINSPAYWAFCWASGQVLGKHILEHAKDYREKRILDFGSGSGVVAIAAALVGASHVIACDNDPNALAASAANARLNCVSIDLLENIEDLHEPLDMVFASDVLYDRDNMSMLESLPNLATDVVIADSRVKNIEIHGYEMIGRTSATTIPDLDEYREFNDVKIYRSL